MSTAAPASPPRSTSVQKRNFPLSPTSVTSSLSPQQLVQFRPQGARRTQRHTRINEIRRPPPLLLSNWIPLSRALSPKSHRALLLPPKLVSTRHCHTPSTYSLIAEHACSLNWEHVYIPLTSKSPSINAYPCALGFSYCTHSYCTPALHPSNENERIHHNNHAIHSLLSAHTLNSNAAVYVPHTTSTNILSLILPVQNTSPGFAPQIGSNIVNTPSLPSDISETPLNRKDAISTAHSSSSDLLSSWKRVNPEDPSFHEDYTGTPSEPTLTLPSVPSNIPSSDHHYPTMKPLQYPLLSCRISTTTLNTSPLPFIPTSCSTGYVMFLPPITRLDTCCAARILGPSVVQVLGGLSDCILHIHGDGHKASSAWKVHSYSLPHPSIQARVHEEFTDALQGAICRFYNGRTGPPFLSSDSPPTWGNSPPLSFLSLLVMQPLL